MSHSSLTSETNHCNPILQHKKPFLTQVKQRAIHPDKYKVNNTSQKIETQEAEEEQKTVNGSIPQPIRGINSYKHEYTPVAQRLQTEMKSNSRNNSRDKSGVIISAVGNLEELNKFLKD